jgi:Tfp pilus assembly protein PilO
MELIKANKKEFVITTVVVITAVAGFFVAAQPKFAKVSEGKQRIRTMDATIQAYSLAVDEMTTLFETASDLEDFEIESDEEILPALLECIASTGEQHGVEILSMKPSRTVHAELGAVLPGDFKVESTRLTVSVTVRARYRALGDYLKSLESISVMVAVRNLSIRRDKQSPSAVLIADFDIETYSLRTENAQTQ